MSLRLLPAIMMDNEEDDDGNFTKWMSSYWGHGSESGHTRERKRSFRRPAKTRVDRRASLPTVSQLDAMKLNKLHAAATAPAPSHIKTRDEKGEARPHQRARHASAEDNRPRVQETRITTIPELTESFEKRLLLSDQGMALADSDKLCLICHEDMRNSGHGVQELHCTHRFHKEAARKLEQCQPHSSSSSSSDVASCQARRYSGERRKSVEGPISVEKEEHAPRRQLSLRRHR